MTFLIIFYKKMSFNNSSSKAILIKVSKQNSEQNIYLAMSIMLQEKKSQKYWNIKYFIKKEGSDL